MRLAMLFTGFLAVLLLTGCLVRTHRYHHGYGPPPPRRNCHSVCDHWATRQECSRRCRAWGGGACLVWESYCRPVRTCVAHATRCH